MNQLPQAERKTVLCDMDGVIVNILPTWLQEYGMRTGEWIHPDDIRVYGHETLVSQPKVWWGCLKEALELAQPMPGSSYLGRLMDDHDVRLVTYCHPAAPQAFAIKQAWMKKFYPNFNPDHMIGIKEKWRVPGDFLIEDSEANLDAWQSANPSGVGVLVRAPYNSGLEDWDTIKTYFEALKGE